MKDLYISILSLFFIPTFVNEELVGCKTDIDKTRSMGGYKNYWKCKLNDAEQNHCFLQYLNIKRHV